MNELWDIAFEQYRGSLGVEAHDETVAWFLRLEGPVTSEIVLDKLEAASAHLRGRRRVNKAARRFKENLKPIIGGLVVLLDAAAEIASSLGAPGGKGIFAAVAVLLKAADRVSATYENLEKLFERFRVYIERLQVRIRVPLKSQSSEIAVRALVEMLKAFELATKMLRKGRIRHFLDALFSTSDDLEDAMRTLEDVTTDEERMAIAELVSDVHHLSSEMQEVKASISMVVQDLNSVQPISQSMSAALQSQNGLILGMLHTLIERTDPATSTRLIVASPATHTQERDVLCNATSRHLVSSSTTTRAGPSSCISLIAYATSRFRHEYQDVLLRGLSILISLAIDVVNSNVSKSLTGLNSAEVAGAVMPTAWLSILLLIVWRHNCIWRPLGRASGSIVIVDMLGDVITLNGDTFTSWETTHAFLLQAFQGRVGVSYVQRREYGLADSNKNYIEPSKWSKSVRPGATLRMSAIVRDLVPRCPYCGISSTSDESRCGDSGIICSNERCGRPYETLREAKPEATQLLFITDPQNSLDTPCPGGSLPKSEDGSRSAIQRIMVIIRSTNESPLLQDLDEQNCRRDAVSRRCLNCHTANLECDRKRPCSHCVRLNFTGLCAYEVEDHPAAQLDPTEAETSRLRARIAELESLVRVLRGKPHE
ncbi:unnamed protein product [Peniophora sp. CBMAI 1063]|nr:unnamed protein product [Peniophora sp. CBMAI 1063]